MTMMHLCDPVALPVESSAAEVSGEMATFLASQLLPMMASIFPKSANQISSNLQGNGLAYGLFLKGLSARQIREALMDLAERTEFAPTPIDTFAARYTANPTSTTTIRVPLMKSRMGSSPAWRAAVAGRAGRSPPSSPQPVRHPVPGSARPGGPGR